MIIMAIAIFLFNIPFGYWRANVRRLSLQWYFAIHIPVPFIIFVRVALDVGWHWFTFAVFILSFFLGQLAGGIMHKHMARLHKDHISSCLFMDMCRKSG
jgi:hypothetical protein